MMMYILTESERRFLIETLTDCAEYSDDLESTCDECLRILDQADTTTVEEYNGE